MRIRPTSARSARPDDRGPCATLVSRWLEAKLPEGLAGDLHELFVARCRTDGRTRARRWYAWQLARAAVRFTPRQCATPRTQRKDEPMQTLVGDIRHGARLLVSAPGFALAAIFTLALAMGASTVIFSMANVLLVKPLPLRDPDTLGWIAMVDPQGGNSRGPIALPELATFQAEADTFQALGGRRALTLTLRRSGEVAERVLANEIIGDLQGIWGMRALHGRTLAADDERQGAPRVAVFSHRFWQRRFAGSPAIVGTSVELDGRPYDVAGVITPDIEIGNLAEVDVWVAHQGDGTLAPRDDRSWRATGRLRPGVGIAEAHAQVEAIGQRLERDFPVTNRGWRTRVNTTREAMVGGNTWLVLTLLITAVILLLVLACANVMNMLLARLATRRQELALRAALGATRGRLVRQLVAEGVLLGIGGAALGLALGWAGLRVMKAAAYEPVFALFSIDTNVLLFAIGMALVAPVLFSTLPAVGALGGDLRSILGESSTRSVGGRANRQRAVLVVAQLTLAVTLLGAAGLVLRTMIAIMRVDPGFTTEGVLTWELNVPAWKYGSDEDVRIVRERLATRLAALPQATRVSSITTLPIFFAPRTRFAVDGRADPTPEDRPWANLSIAGDGYFQLMEIPLLQGRPFEPGDRADTSPVAVVSRETARRYWGGVDRALGATIRLADEGARAGWHATVVGVVADTANPDLEQAPDPHLYLLDAQHPPRQYSVVIRSPAPERLAEAARAAVLATDPDVAIYKMRTVDDAIADEMSSNYIVMSLFIAFAVVAILLAATGLYGVMAYTVSRRASEIAVRMALGASEQDIARQMLGEGLRLTGVGIAFGLGGAFVLAHVMASVLFGVSPTDVSTYGGVVLITLLAVLPAVWVPARRAIRVDPIRNLKNA